MAKSTPSICFDCKNGYAHKCEWVHTYTPVPGWEYKDVMREKTKGIQVIKCPNFERESDAKRNKTVRTERILELAKNSKLSVRMIAEKVGVSDYTVQQEVKKLKRKVACVKCGAEFEKKGSQKWCDKCRKEKKK